MKATNIIWETDGEVVYLPTEVDLPSRFTENDTDEISNYLSDEKGFLVVSFSLLNNDDKEAKTREKKEKLISDIRDIVNGKKFTFSEAYIKYAGQQKIGVGEMSYNAVTKKYVYVGCFMEYGYNEKTCEYGAYIKKYPLMNNAYGRNVNKVRLEDLFSVDLQKILDDIYFYLWFESCVNLPKVRAEYERLLEVEKVYKKMMERNEQQ